MVQNPVKNGCRNDVILEDISPFAIGFIGGENGRSFFIPSGYQLEETVRA
jgi:hypothetical protein